jgi:hypothetical protein
MRPKPTNARPTMLQIFWSMIAAFCGIQSNGNHDRDDEYIDEVGFRPYIIAGIALTLVCIGVIWLIVKLILMDSV